MAYFKVEDVVTLRKDINEDDIYHMHDDENEYNTYDSSFMPKAGECLRIKSFDYINGKQYLVYGNREYFFTDEMFEEYDPRFNTYEDKLIAENTIKTEVESITTAIDILHPMQFDHEKSHKAKQRLYTQEEVDKIVANAIYDFKKRIMDMEV